MCNFFSFVGDGYGNFLYSDWEDRKVNLSENWDSHTFILTQHKVPAQMQDRWSKYEYSPITKVFTIDEPATNHDHTAAENWVRSLNFKTIIPQLIIKPIINPLQGNAKKVTEKEIDLLKQWDSVRNSVWGWGNVWASIRSSAGNSVKDSVWDSVKDSVWDSVKDSVWDSIRDSVRANVRNSVRDSIWDSVWAYYSSFFNIAYQYDFSIVEKLWNAGFIASFDGTAWRLHSGKNAKIMYKWKKE